MAKKMYAAFASFVTVILGLTFAEPPSAFAIHDQQQRQEQQRSVNRRNHTARQKVKTRRKTSRHRISYVCPMHPDIRSKSHDKCPKCLMDLVAERGEAKKSGR
jgi:chromosome condensin MukBEF ATPase and DNA-binding subunit MukB